MEFQMNPFMRFWFSKRSSQTLGSVPFTESYPTHVALKAGPIEFNGIYPQGSMCRLVSYDTLCVLKFLKDDWHSSGKLTFEMAHANEENATALLCFILNSALSDYMGDQQFEYETLNVINLAVQWSISAGIHTLETLAYWSHLHGHWLRLFIYPAHILRELLFMISVHEYLVSLCSVLLPFKLASVKASERAIKYHGIQKSLT